MSLPKNRDKYTCFISSPSDCEKEREFCRKTIRSLSKKYQNKYGVEIECLGWDDLPPAIDNDPQLVINKGIKGKYQLFIGIMNQKFGTKTQRAGSGTEEEYDEAFKVWFKNRNSIEVMFYFNESLTQDDSNTQLRKKNKFKEKVRKHNLYRGYKGYNDFKDKIKKDIENTFNNLFEDKTNDNTHPFNRFEIVKEKACSYEYRTLWQKNSRKLNKGVKINSLKKLYTCSEKDSNLFPKIVHNQSHAIDCILNKKLISIENANILALAINDIGMLPSYYRKITDYKELDNLELWKKLKIKEATLIGDLPLIESNGNDSLIYENIQRMLYHLDFENALSNICKWNPSGYWKLPKAMRLACYHDNIDDATKLLEDYVKNEKNPTLNLYGRQFSNFISNVWKKYNIDDFVKYGIDGIDEILDYMVNQLISKPPKVKRRGWVGATYKFGSSYYDFEKSLRILRFISDSGIFVGFNVKSYLNTNIWYIVFKNLYEHFPYPSFFYSIQYNDTELLMRIGQDFAFSPKLVKFNEDILVKAIKAIANKNTPNMLVNSLLNLSKELYVSVNEEIWFNDFKRIIFNTLLVKLESIQDNDPLVSNVSEAIACIRNQKHKECIFRELFSVYKLNQKLMDSLISDISFVKSECFDYEEIINPLIEDYPNMDITFIMYILMHKKVLTDNLLIKFINKIKGIEIDKLPQDLASSFFLCILTQNDSIALKKVKENFLSKDVWCNVIENRHGWIISNSLRMEVFCGKIKWSNLEFNKICDNLISNINNCRNDVSHDSFMVNNQLEYFLCVVQYIKSLSARRKSKLTSMELQIKEFFDDIVSHKTMIEQMMSQQTINARYALDRLLICIKLKGFEAYLAEINFIIDKALDRMTPMINIFIKTIRQLIQDYPNEMSREENLMRLNLLLKIYKENWIKASDFCPNISFNNLSIIAEYLNGKDYKNKNEEAIKYWMDDEFIKRFI